MSDGRLHVESIGAGQAITVAGESFAVSKANIAIASTGDNTLVAAVTGKKIVVVSLYLIAAGDVTAYFVDGANTAISGDATNGLTLTASSGFALNRNIDGWFETAAGQSLDLNLSGAVTVAGALNYIEV